MMLKKDDVKKSVGKYEATRCKFERFGKQCRLTGTVSYNGGEDARYYCTFHNDVITMSDGLNKFSEFKKWHEDFLSHYPLEVYGSPIYDKDGYFLNYRGGDFHNNNTEQLWAMMGNEAF